MIFNGCKSITGIAAMNNIQLNPDEIYLSARQVKDRLSIGHATLYELRKSDPTFPQLFRIGPRLSRWKLSELEEWVNSKRA